MLVLAPDPRPLAVLSAVPASAGTRQYSSASSTSAGAFTESVADQVAAFKRDGFVLIKKPEEVRLENICEVGTEVAAMLDSQQSTWK